MDPKAVWCSACGHHNTRHTHRGYKKIQGYIGKTIRGECEVIGGTRADHGKSVPDGSRCPCRGGAKWVTREHVDALLRIRARREGLTPQT
jgi:hypothetical protein